MKTRRLTRSNFKRIHDVACTDWKSYLEVEFKDLLFKDEVVVSEPFYNKMRKAATTSQNTLLDEIFGKDDNSIMAKDLKCGEAMKLTETIYKDMVVIKTYDSVVLIKDVSITWEKESNLRGIKCPSGTKLEIITK